MLECENRPKLLETEYWSEEIEQIDEECKEIAEMGEEVN
jgi:hypothetical protein